MSVSTYEQRLEQGQAQRKQMKRAEHAGWNARARTVDPWTLLERSGKGRVPRLLTVKYERMSVSPFTFFRGSAMVMAYDLSLGANTGIVNQICGDAHVNNLGAYEGADGRLVFDINDFDETIRAPFEWDVKRMATSVLLAGRDAGSKETRCQAAAEVMLSSYRTGMLELARMTVLDVARHQVRRIADIPAIAQVMTVAERSTPLHTLAALTEEKGTERIFQTKPPVLERVTGAKAKAVVASLTTYAETLLPERRHLLARYRVVDVAFKVVGTGSVGLRDYVVYLEGNGPGDPLFLQIKEEVASAYAPYLGRVVGIAAHQGQRVVEGERAMQLQSDPFLGWTTLEGRQYLVRQLNDHKAAIDLSSLKAEALPAYAALCGELLARSHARAGESAVIAGYMGDSTRFDEATLHFALAYAEQTERDYKRLLPKMRGASKA